MPVAQYAELTKRAAATADPEVKARLLAAVRLRYEVLLNKMLDDHLPAGVMLTVRFTNDTDRDMTLPLWSQTENAELFRFSITGPDGKELVGPIPRSARRTLAGGRQFAVRRRQSQGHGGIDRQLGSAGFSDDSAMVFSPAQASTPSRANM